MLLVQEDQSCSVPDSTVGLPGKPPSPARNSQGCWKPENFTFIQYFISDIPFFSPLWCWQWQDEKAFWEPLPPAARHSCQPWTIFKKSLFNPGSTNSAKVITCQVCTKLLSITCKEVESDKDKEYTKIKNKQTFSGTNDSKTCLQIEDSNTFVAPPSFLPFLDLQSRTKPNPPRPRVSSWVYELFLYRGFLSKVAFYSV